MGNPLYAMLFAEDLMEFVLKHHGITWIENRTGVRRFRDRIQKHCFRPEVGKAVCDLIAENDKTITDCYRKLILKGVDCVDDFRYEITITTIFYLRYGYNRLRYLELCALFSGIACRFFENGDQIFARDVASASTQLLAYIINFSTYDETLFRKEAWFDLLITARIISRKIENGSFYMERDTTYDIMLPYFQTVID